MSRFSFLTAVTLSLATFSSGHAAGPESGESREKVGVLVFDTALDVRHPLIRDVIDLG